MRGVKSKKKTNPYEKELHGKRNIKLSVHKHLNLTLFFYFYLFCTFLSRELYIMHHDVGGKKQ